MRISIVVPAFNEEKLLPGTLRSIGSATEAFHARGWEAELIVCDNNSTDRTAEIARSAGARVVFEPVNQIARARNAGAAAANGDWLLFIDADSHPSRELFADVAGAIARGDCAAGGVTVKMDAFAPTLSFCCHLWNVISRVNRWMAGSFIFCEAAAFRAIGGFSQEFYVSEELDLSRRFKAFAAAHGKRIIILRRHPLITSARKIRLYGYGAHLRMLWRVIVFRGRTLRAREECAIWYDGRR